ncbi:MAG TPA: type I-B CRISPR-associated endonuclease Cas1b [Saprospiraceae bacterium]|nr:type I-B CRISPR-associated endonuclease Cas1b [Saprospiraceae bacterium]HRK82435.1 type I-B CRISPR-associated endonuclease Cas1b [Saprospiraceae bacterium]
MKKAYYLFNPGRAERRDHTIRFIPMSEDGVEDKPRYLPVEGVSALYIFGNIDANSAFYNYMGQQHIPVHFFDYHEHYTGSFSPREYLLAGKLLVAQAQCYLKPKRRLHIAQALVDAACFNMLKNLRYYGNRGRDMETIIARLEQLRAQIPLTHNVPELLGIEGNSRQTYYSAFGQIITTFAMEGRSKRPPKDEVNALISFGNAMCYTLALDAIYHSQLNPTISYLHEPGARRYSLALDIAEVFKPILVDRLIFRLCNKRELQSSHFEDLNGTFLLKDKGRKIFLNAWEEKLNETIAHRHLDKQVSYRRLVKLECYKLVKYILDMENQYEGFKIWW